MPIKRGNKWQAVFKVPHGLDVLWVGGRAYKPNGRRIRITFDGNQEQCEAYERTLARLADEQLRDIRLGLPQRAPTFAEYAAEWVAARGDSRTDDTYRNALRLHVVPFFGEMQLNVIWASHVLAFKAQKAREGYKPNTVNLHLAAFKGVMKAAHGAKLIAKLPPHSRVKVDSLKRLPDDKWWRDDEIARVIETLKQQPERFARILHLVPLGLATGLRSGELFGLRWDDVTGDVIQVRQQFTRQKGFSKLKTEASVRDLPINARAAHALSQQRAVTQLRDGLVFQQPDGSPYDSNYIQNQFKALCRTAKVRTITPHCMRHTFASWVLSTGKVDIIDLKGWLGHENINNTLIYVHLCPDKSKEKALSLPGWHNTVLSQNNTTTR